MGKVLSQQQIDQYHEQGFIAPIDVMPESEALEYAQRLQTAELEYPEELNAENRNNPHLSFKFLDELVYHPLILDVVEDLIGPAFTFRGYLIIGKFGRRARARFT